MTSAPSDAAQAEQLRIATKFRPINSRGDSVIGPPIGGTARRRTQRLLMPTLRFLIEGQPLVSVDWSLGGLQVEPYAVTLRPVACSQEKPPGPRSRGAWRKRVKSPRARCVFREPQFPAKLAETVAEGTGARIAVLDPEGTIGMPGTNLYFELMRANVRALAECLEDG